MLRRIVEADRTRRILVLSAVGDVESRVRCLRMGAVDYLAKPFSIAELMERVKRRIEDQNRNPSARWLEVNGVRLDLHRRTLRAGGREVPLSQREFILLGHLIATRRRGVHSSRTARRRMGILLRSGQQRGGRMRPAAALQAGARTHRDGAQCRLQLRRELTAGSGGAGSSLPAPTPSPCSSSPARKPSPSTSSGSVSLSSTGCSCGPRAARTPSWPWWARSPAARWCSTYATR